MSSCSGDISRGAPGALPAAARRPSWTGRPRWSSCPAGHLADARTPRRRCATAGRGHRTRPGAGRRRPPTRSGAVRRRVRWPRPAGWPAAPARWWSIVGRPSLAEDGALVAEAAPAHGQALPTARFLPALRRGNVHGRPRHGPGSRAAARSGRPRRRTRLVHRGLGLGARGPGPGRRHRWPAAAAAALADGPPCARWSCSGPTRWRDFPDRRAGRPGLSGADFVVAVAASPTACPSTPTWSCRPPRPTSGRGRPPTSRAGSPGWARSWCPRGRPGRTG